MERGSAKNAACLLGWFFDTSAVDARVEESFDEEFREMGDDGVEELGC